MELRGDRNLEMADDSGEDVDLLLYPCFCPREGAEGHLALGGDRGPRGHGRSWDMGRCQPVWPLVRAAIPRTTLPRLVTGGAHADPQVPPPPLTGEEAPRGPGLEGGHTAEPSLTSRDLLSRTVFSVDTEEAGGGSQPPLGAFLPAPETSSSFSLGKSRPRPGSCGGWGRVGTWKGKESHALPSATLGLMSHCHLESGDLGSDCFLPAVWPQATSLTSLRCSVSWGQSQCESLLSLTQLPDAFLGFGACGDWLST